MGGKRAPIFAGAAVVAVVLIVTFFLVLPKAGQVKDADAALTEAQAQQATLGAQLAALQQAEAEAPINRETIRKVQQAIPPTVDQQGFILLLQNAAVQSSIDIVTITPSNPDLRSGHGPLDRDEHRHLHRQLLRGHRVPVPDRDAPACGEDDVGRHRPVTIGDEREPADGDGWRSTCTRATTSAGPGLRARTDLGRGRHRRRAAAPPPASVSPAAVTSQGA